MKKVKFIYNPYSGENAILEKLDEVIRIHQEAGYSLVPYRIDKTSDLIEAFSDAKDENYHYVLIAGGDGTVDSVVNAMAKCGVSLPIGILPVGTANDFAKFLGIPFDIKKACMQILSSEVTTVDLGRINDKYFINVASTGLFTDVSQKTDVNLKNTIGKLAYYLKGLEELPNFRKLKVKINSKEVDFDGEMYFMLVFNGKTAGNFNLATHADATDGLLDVIVFKAIPIRELIPLFIKVLKGDHLESDNVLYFKTDSLIIESPEDIVTDIDGERGPEFPLNIKCIKGGLKILGVK
ncbi:YegS/Rv2252/BmrU family lipid kinase [Clostridium gasigenes]|uniref:Lipid kinase, YegS/Rv2252/BmrU family n=1 Tax=Clostridium gasigenes TaxID=94869 RepID=A0A1H0V043_9CLOT|nr:YegS/Rv2252/BmrU family lipid kinase [Clostridium gasigenes]MBB6624017.1 YegS/Rv2252/BmrU family lipid kinase [Clostridium gasigenes]MBB6716518.1 YegS/Rv2252/BmrU family lipid kinase [Clostridium gasigenes]MBU3088359.1 YegS/Rv2252/BmrU family lipid kinase [Clostridium gasigenes]MBU3103283.1 YegS/Rv2252/BmrU family lipid kinase [Clostridium gasigenes]MBU3133292.1 YegS/Rv2252/BmrU family lipid kinase [Clostridium gasigenes]